MESDTTEAKGPKPDPQHPQQCEIEQISNRPMDKTTEILIAMHAWSHEIPTNEASTMEASSGASQWPRGEHWKSTRSTFPASWAPNAKLCDCPEHHQTTWPAEHVVLNLPKCTLRCPYCNFKASKKRVRGKTTRGAAAEVRRHIRHCHLMKAVNRYPGISVQMVHPPNLKYCDYGITHGGPPCLEDDNPQDQHAQHKNNQA